VNGVKLKVESHQQQPHEIPGLQAAGPGGGGGEKEEESQRWFQSYKGESAVMCKVDSLRVSRPILFVESGVEQTMCDASHVGFLRQHPAASGHL